MLFQTQTGPAAVQDGNVPVVRSGKQGDMIVSTLHGRYYEQTYRNNVYSSGSAVLTALSANTITLTSGTTPIIGLWNPSSSTVNCVMLHAGLQAVINTFTTPVGAGAFVWATSVGNTAVPAGGATPINRKTLLASGAQAKIYTAGAAMNSLTNNLTYLGPSDFTSPSSLTYGTITAPTTGTTITPFGGVHMFEGDLIIPPGGILALLNTNLTTTMSVTARLVWEEVPV